VSSAVSASARANFNTIGLAFANASRSSTSSIGFICAKASSKLRLTDAVVVNHELGIRHVLRVAGAHHFGKHQVNRSRAEEFQVTKLQFRNRQGLVQSVAAQEHLPLAEQVRDVVYAALCGGEFPTVRTHVDASPLPIPYTGIAPPHG
jgi:hypothetical protein